MLEDKQSKTGNQLQNISFHSVMRTHKKKETSVTQKRTKEAISSLLKKALQQPV